jgi:hypothetical protein
MNENYQEASATALVKYNKKRKTFLPMLKHQQGLISQFVLRFRKDCGKLESEVFGEFKVFIKSTLMMLRLWILIFVPLSFEVLKINSIILHEHKVMKERNFGN